MTPTDAFLANPKGRWPRFRLWLWVTGPRVRDWFLRWIYAQHNARVIIDFENRMSWLLCEATGSRMSKPYYEIETMRPILAEFQQDSYEDAYAEGRKDTAEEFDIVLPDSGTK